MDLRNTSFFLFWLNVMITKDTKISKVIKNALLLFVFSTRNVLVLCMLLDVWMVVGLLLQQLLVFIIGWYLLSFEGLVEITVKL